MCTSIVPEKEDRHVVVQRRVVLVGKYTSKQRTCPTTAEAAHRGGQRGCRVSIAAADGLTHHKNENL